MIFMALTGCPDYQYGVNCQLTCGHCEKDETCDPVTGVCVNGCVPGFTGVECKQGLLPMTCHCQYEIKLDGKCLIYNYTRTCLETAALLALLDVLFLIFCHFTMCVVIHSRPKAKVGTVKHV